MRVHGCKVMIKNDVGWVVGGVSPTVIHLALESRIPTAEHHKNLHIFLQHIVVSETCQWTRRLAVRPQGCLFPHFDRVNAFAGDGQKWLHAVVLEF